MASKIFASSMMYLPEEVIKGLSECNDPFILLDFVEASDKLNTLRSWKEQNRLESFRREIISKIPFVIEQPTPIVISKANNTNINLNSPNIGNLNLTTIGSIGSLNGLGMNGFNGLGDMKQQQTSSFTERSIVDYQRIMENEPIDTRPSYLTVRLLSLSTRMKDVQFAENVTRFMKDLLDDDRSEVGSFREQFTVRVKTAALPVAQSLLARLLQLHKSDIKYTLLAEQLLNAMEPVVITDKTALHWLHRFVVKYYRMITPTIKNALNSILTKLPNYEKFYCRTISEMIALLMKSDMELLSSSDTMCCEYSSCYMHCLHFSVCSILLSDISTKEIVEQLLQPVYKIDKEMAKRNVCCTVAAHIATMLPSALSYSFFFGLFLRPLPEYAIESARYFIILSKLTCSLKFVRIVKKLSAKILTSCPCS